MLPVRSCLLFGRDAELDRHETATQALQLGKYEPHPVARFGASSQLGADVVKYPFLRPDEALKVLGNGHSLS